AAFLTGPEVADDAALDQRLHHRIAVGMREARLAAALGGGARRREGQAEAGAARLDALDEERGEGDRLVAQRRHAAVRRRLAEDLEAALERAHREDRRRAADEAADAERGPV